MNLRASPPAAGFEVYCVGLSSALHRLGPATAKDLVQHTQIDKGQVSRALASMLAEGYVALAGSGAEAGRLTSLTKAALTPRGEELHRRAVGILGQHYVDVLAPLSAEDRRSLHRVLILLMDVGGETDPAAARQGSGDLPK